MLEFRIKVLNILTVTFVTLYSLTFIVSYFFKKELTYVTIFVFMGLGIGFFTTGIVMIRSIKKHFVEFYEKVSCALWAATILLAIPMFLRAFNWFA